MIKVLVVNIDPAGVGKFRLIDPHVKLQEMYKDDVFVDITDKFDLNDEQKLKEYNIIFFHRTLVEYEKMPFVINKLKKLGLITIMDMDDYWILPNTHLGKALIEQSNPPKSLINNIMLVDYVTTTTNYFANIIRKYNKNVIVLENGVDPKEEQFISNKNQSNRVRVGFVGGSCYDYQTKIKTRNGFKYFYDLDENDHVATFNPENGKMEYKKPTSYIKDHYEGEMIHINDVYDMVNLKINPTHNLYIRYYDEETYQLVQAKEVLEDGRDFYIMVNPYFDYPSQFDLYDKITLLDDEKNDVSINFTFKEVCVLFSIFLLNPPRFDNLLKDTEFENITFKYANSILEPLFNKYKLKYEIQNNKFFVSKDERFNILFRSYHGKDKYAFIYNFLFLLNNENLKQFALTLKEVNEKILFLNSNTSVILRLENVEDLINLKYLFYRAGFNSELVFDDNNRIIIKYEDLLEYSDEILINQSTDISKIDYNEYIYCVEVPNHIIYVYRNGCMMWCGNSHLGDIELMRDGFQLLDGSKKTLNNFQLVLCGFDLRGDEVIHDYLIDELKNDLDKLKIPITKPLYIAIQRANGNLGNIKELPLPLRMKYSNYKPKVTKKQIDPYRNVWYNYEKIFTNNHKLIEDKKYHEFLHQFLDAQYPDIENQFYRRNFTRPIKKYATHYNDIDIALAPLVENDFNQCKSPLKMIEAGIFKIPIIVSNIFPYKEIAKDGENCFVIDSKRGHKDWYKKIKLLIENKDLREEMGNKLYETIIEKYHLEKITEKRYKFYKDLVDIKNFK